MWHGHRDDSNNLKRELRELRVVSIGECTSTDFAHSSEVRCEAKTKIQAAEISDR